MKEIPFSELIGNDSFQIAGFILFFLGFILAHLYPLVKWHYFRAQHYCDVLNRICWSIPLRDEFKDNTKILFEKLAAEATERLHYKTNKNEFTITWQDDIERFEVLPTDEFIQSLNHKTNGNETRNTTEES